MCAARVFRSYECKLAHTHTRARVRGGLPTRLRCVCECVRVRVCVSVLCVRVCARRRINTTQFVCVTSPLLPPPLPHTKDGPRPVADGGRGRLGRRRVVRKNKRTNPISWLSSVSRSGSRSACIFFFFFPFLFSVFGIIVFDQKYIHTHTQTVFYYLYILICF